VLVVGPGNIATVRPVKVGDLQGGNWVILEGLKAGEKVITDGLQKVMPDKPVRIAKPGQPASAQAAGAQPAGPAGAPAPAQAKR